MYSKAVKLSLNETEYKQHAWVMEPANNLVDGHPVDREYVVGDTIALYGGDVIVTEVFDCFDFHSHESMRGFNTANLCYNCHKSYADRVEYMSNHEGYYGMKCSKAA